jgi:uncharacterized DUF497 family protein
LPEKLIVATIRPVIVWDEKKRLANLEKHGLDFEDAHRVFDNPGKITTLSYRGGESRQLDVALVEESGLILAFVYVHRGDAVRAISFRIASRRKRRLYAKECEELD